MSPSSPSNRARADTFGSGPNTFDIEFVTIGNPGNDDDTSGDPNPAGKVDYNYRMGKFEISEDMIDKANTLGGLGLTHNNQGPNKPATFISWLETAKFVNWLNGSTPAYKFDGGGNFQLWPPGDAGYNPNNLYRNGLAKYFLLSMNEWYKAAHHDATAGTAGVYFDFATGSNTAPTAVASGTAAGTAVYSLQTGPADITLAGGLSPYGTMGQSGNVWEYEETDFDLMNDSATSDHGTRGGFWFDDFGNLSALNRSNTHPADENASHGFRVASVPEPSSLLLTALGLFGLVGCTWRRRR